MLHLYLDSSVALQSTTKAILNDSVLNLPSRHLNNK